MVAPGAGTREQEVTVSDDWGRVHASRYAPLELIVEVGIYGPHTVTEEVNLRLEPAHGIHDRIDLVATDGITFRVLTGTPAVSPHPSVLPEWDTPIAEVYVRAGFGLLSDYDITMLVDGPVSVRSK